MKRHKINPVPYHDKDTDFDLIKEFFKAIKDGLSDDEKWDLIFKIQKEIK